MAVVTDTVRGEIVTELSQLTGLDVESLTPDASLRDLDIDSLDMAEFQQVVEDRYDVHFSRDDFAGVETVGQALDAMVARLG
jgi:acyl carrier protein